MGRASTFDAWNAYLGGKLGALLLEKRGHGESFEQIARHLYREHEIDVSSDTVRRWCEKAAA